MTQNGIIKKSDMLNQIIYFTYKISNWILWHNLHAFKEGGVKTVHQKNYTSDLRLGIWYHATLILCCHGLFTVTFLGSTFIQIYLVEKFESSENMKYPSAWPQRKLCLFQQGQASLGWV